jgi:uncharacterized membrane protein YsdA (DUF1294 family)
MNTPMMGILIWLVLVNGVTFACFGLDKTAARTGARRIPEAQLLLLGLLGGTPGAFIASRLFRHKTKKQPFRNHLIMIAACQTIILVALFKMILSDQFRVFTALLQGLLAIN